MTDEDEIRELLRRWRHATAEGDVSGLLPLMAEDVAGEFAYCWNDVVLQVMPPDPAPALQLAGPDLTILRKEPNRGWVVFRAASMLVPAERSTQP